MNNNKAFTMDQTEVRTIAKNLKKLMESRGVSEIEIARALNTSVMTIRRIISGETEDPRISTLKLITDYFQVSIDSLIEDNNGKSLRTMIKNTPLVVPILTWSVIEDQGVENLSLGDWPEWYTIAGDQDLIDEYTFAIESRPSMHPRFPMGTLFFINPIVQPIDGDLILIKFKNECNLSLRELIIDYPKWQLQAIIPGSETIYYDKQKHDIIGVVVLSLLRKRR
ncbi:XRE family transcriptional regulator [Legionella lytica]|uniref:XRE family transcriptional regulator n=1 Tax=Legionella lytica TaxID=96232 RepID=A0ABW8DBI8_9GAMM